MTSTKGKECELQVIHNSQVARMIGGNNHYSGVCGVGGVVISRFDLRFSWER